LTRRLRIVFAKRTGARQRWYEERVDRLQHVRCPARADQERTGVDRLRHRNSAVPELSIHHTLRAALAGLAVEAPEDAPAEGTEDMKIWCVDH
jgi:hypothetical protein